MTMIDGEDGLYICSKPYPNTVRPLFTDERLYDNDSLIVLARRLMLLPKYFTVYVTFMSFVITNPV